MFNKLFNAMFDENEDLKFGIGLGLIALCIVLAGLVQGM